MYPAGLINSKKLENGCKINRTGGSVQRRRGGCAFCALSVHHLEEFRYAPLFQVWTLCSLGMDAYSTDGQGMCVIPRSASLWLPHPKHLLRHDLLSEGKLDELSLRGTIFSPRDNFPLKIAFPFPSKWPVFHETKGLRKRRFYGLREDFWLSPRGKIYLKPLFCLKRCYGHFRFNCADMYACHGYWSHSSGHFACTCWSTALHLTHGEQLCGMKDFHLPLHSRSVFFNNWDGPRARKRSPLKNFPVLPFLVLGNSLSYSSAKKKYLVFLGVLGSE